MSNYEVTFVGSPFVVVVVNAKDATNARRIALDALPLGFVVEDEAVYEMSEQLANSQSYADAVIDAGDES